MDQLHEELKQVKMEYCDEHSNCVDCNELSDDESPVRLLPSTENETQSDTDYDTCESHASYEPSSASTSLTSSAVITATDTNVCTNNNMMDVPVTTAVNGTIQDVLVTTTSPAIPMPNTKDFKDSVNLASKQQQIVDDTCNQYVDNVANNDEVLSDQLHSDADDDASGQLLPSRDHTSLCKQVNSPTSELKHLPSPANETTSGNIEMLLHKPTMYKRDSVDSFDRAATSSPNKTITKNGKSSFFSFCCT